MNTLVKNAALVPFNLLYKVSPKLCLQLLFRIKQGYSLDLERPRTLSEKIQWIKLNDRSPLMPCCADKFAVRSYVEERGCGRYLNELIWHGNDPADIPFDDLPGKFVIKVTHGSTFNYLQDGSTPVDKREIIRLCRRWLKTDFLPCYGEWFYGRGGGIAPSIVVERYLDADSPIGLVDYKVFVMNGHARFVMVASDRAAGARYDGSHHDDFYDTDWKLMSVSKKKYPNSSTGIERPACLRELLSVAERLAEPFNLARVDFYVAGGGASQRPVFGEITFTPGSGFDAFDSYESDALLGDMLRLPCDPSAPLGRHQPTCRGALDGQPHERCDPRPHEPALPR